MLVRYTRVRFAGLRASAFAWSSGWRRVLAERSWYHRFSKGGGLSWRHLAPLDDPVNSLPGR
jgi:hypothetical protein